MNRIDDKIEEIRKYLKELEKIIPKSFEAYENNFEKKAACERYFEKIIEAATDLAYLIIKRERLDVPEENKIFEVLFENKIISKKIFSKLKMAKGMRNIIAHRYGEIEDEIVFESISEELIGDVENFINEISQGLIKE